MKFVHQVGHWLRFPSELNEQTEIWKGLNLDKWHFYIILMISTKSVSNQVILSLAGMRKPYSCNEFMAFYFFMAH